MFVLFNINLFRFNIKIYLFEHTIILKKHNIQVVTKDSHISYKI